MQVRFHTLKTQALGVEPQNAKRQALALVFLAAVALAAGLAVYVLDRAPGSAMAWPAAWSFGQPGGGSAGHGWVRVVSGSLPSIAHAFSFAVLSALLLPPTRLWTAAACITWSVIDSCFEALQHPSLSAPAAQWLRELEIPTPLQWCASRTAAYLSAGRFDPWDLLAGVVGAMAAFVVFRATLQAVTKPAAH